MSIRIVELFYITIFVMIVSFIFLVKILAGNSKIKQELVLISLILLFLSFIAIAFNINTTKYEIPYGIWQSSNPDITINITQQSFDMGIYNENGKIINIYTVLSHTNTLIIYEAEIDKNDEMFRGKYKYFNGTWKIKEDKLYYNLSRSFRRSLGYKTIIFELIEEFNEDN